MNYWDMAESVDFDLLESAATSKFINIVIKVTKKDWRCFSGNLPWTIFTGIPAPVSHGFGVRKLYSDGRTQVRRPRLFEAHHSAALTLPDQI